MSDWIDFGGHAPYSWTDEVRGNKYPENSQPRRAGRQRTPLTIGFAALLLALASHLGHARDLDGRYANSPLKQWFDSLRSGKGPCCSDADGTAISDADWESGNGHYRVRVEGEWVEVPDEAVITESRRTHHGMAYPRLWRGDHPLLHAGINDMTVA